LLGNENRFFGREYFDQLPAFFIIRALSVYNTLNFCSDLTPCSFAGRSGAAFGTKGVALLTVKCSNWLHAVFKPMLAPLEA